MRPLPDAAVNLARPIDVSGTRGSRMLDVAARREIPRPASQANQPAKETVTVTTTQSMSTSNAALGHPGTAAAFRKIKLLDRRLLGISALAVVAIVLMRNHSAEVNSSVWTHGSSSPPAPW